MRDYYGGHIGARRLLDELDEVLQGIIEAMPGARLECEISLTVADGGRARLRKDYEAPVK